MQDFPHFYQVSASGGPEGEVSLGCEGIESIASAAPVQFGGPGDRWSPEELLVAAVADCFILTFRALASYSKLPWTSLDCDAQGKLERADGKPRFTEFSLRVRLVIPADADEERARGIAEKSEQNCLVTNSLSAATQLQIEIAKGN